MGHFLAQMSLSSQITGLGFWMNPAIEGKPLNGQISIMWLKAPYLYQMMSSEMWEEVDTEWVSLCSGLARKLEAMPFLCRDGQNFSFTCKL